MSFLDQQAREIVDVMIKAGVLDEKNRIRAEAMLGVSLGERIGPLIGQQDSSEEEE